MNKYSEMQLSIYNEEAQKWTKEQRDYVVGSFDLHNNWKDYDDYLFKGINTTDKIALEFGCGPGRNIVKFSNQFKQIDGVDISQFNLNNVIIWKNENNITKSSNLYLNNGEDLSCIEGDNIYDIIFSTICMQHICVHEIRFKLFQEFYRLLKPSGSVCIQMGYGVGHPRSVSYYDNNWEASTTNGGMDTRVEDANFLKIDLEKIGFKNFDFDIRPVGPGDGHSNWIFFRSIK